MSQVAVNSCTTPPNACEHQRAYLRWLSEVSDAAANVCGHSRISAGPPCKRAVVSSILTGGSALGAVSALVNAVLWPNTRAAEAGLVGLLYATVAAVVWFSTVFYFQRRSTSKDRYLAAFVSMRRVAAASTFAS